MNNGWLLGAIIVGLFMFGVIYNAIVAWMERSGHDRGFTSFLVVGGVLVTVLALSPLIGLENLLVIGLGFAASGLPMVVGSWARYARSRARDETKAKELAMEALNHDTP